MTQATQENPFTGNVHPLPGHNPDDILAGGVAVPGQPDDDDPEAVDDGPEDAAVDDQLSADAAKKSAKDKPADDEFPSIEKDWKYHVLELRGRKYGVRIPDRQAITAFSMATGAYIPGPVQHNVTTRFMFNHVSPQSYTFLMYKMTDPNDTELTEDIFDEITTELFTLGNSRLLAEAEAKAEMEKAKGKKPAGRPRRPRQ